MSAFPARIGATSFGMSAALYWLSGVGIDDHVGAVAHTGVNPREERLRKALVAAVAYNMVHTVLFRDLNGPVLRTVIHYEPLNFFKPLHLTGEAPSGQVAASFSSL